MELLIKETLEKLLKVLNVSFSSVKVSKESDGVFYAEIKTAQSNLLIGWHGETIAALQHMLKCMLWTEGAKIEGQIVVDVDGYKKRQEESVIRLAERKAEVAAENQKPIILPVMNAYFRRKVHTHLASSDRFSGLVTTESVGKDPNRSVRILPK